MGRKARILLSGTIAFGIAGFAVLPMSWKLALGFAYRRYPVVLHDSVYFVNPHAIAHALAFGGSAFFLMALPGSVRYRALVMLGLTSLALVTETAQHYIYRNAIEWNDIQLDLWSIGIACLLTLAAVVFRSLAANSLRRQAAEPPA